MQKKVKNIRHGVFYVMFCLGFVSVLYFSWVNSPNLATTGLLPRWLTNWSDDYHNDTRRTAVPFIFLGIIVGFHLLMGKAKTKVWALYYVLMVLLVCLAEFVQIFLPKRVFDIRDIVWACFATTLVLLFFYIFSRLTNRWKIPRSTK